MNAWHRFWYGDVAALRTDVLLRFVLGLLGFDCWIELTAHGARYGSAGFNVPHFATLDFLPSPGFYVGTVTLAGLLALTQAIHRPHRLGLALVFALYTLAWACSMLDSYQHHYLLSLLLGCFVFFPLNRGHRGRLAAPAYVMTGVTCSLVYFYTAVTKLSADWRGGDALRRLIKDARGSKLAETLHIDVETLWPLLAAGAIALQLATMIGFLWAVTQDRSDPERSGLRLGHLMLAAPLAFHIGAEVMGLRIGWFSYYMIGIALIFFAPESWLRSSVRALATPLVLLRRLGVRLPEKQRDTIPPTEREANRARSFYLGTPILLGAAMLGALVDLPGVKVASSVASLCVLVMMGTEIYAAETMRAGRTPFYRSVAFFCASLALLATVTFTPVRFDYYRWEGGDFRSRGDYVSALRAYEKANQYAPTGIDRKAKEDAMRLKVQELGLGDAPGSP